MKILLIGSTLRTRNLLQAWQSDPRCYLEWYSQPPAAGGTRLAADLVVCEDNVTPEVRQFISRTLQGQAAQPLALLYHPYDAVAPPEPATGPEYAAWPPKGARVLEFHAPLPPRRRAVW